MFLRRSLIFVHRWLGVALSLIFCLWFVSGIVMMYWSFPEITARDRLERAPVLDPARITIAPEEAYAALARDQPPGQVRLASFDGRPVYFFAGQGGRGGVRGSAGVVYADDGAVQREADEEMSDRAAERWARRPIAEAARSIVEEVDQWTVGGALRSQLPLLKYTWPGGQQVYVNGDTAEVVQYTTTASRVWAYLGAIPHWLYFTPLRKHQPQWSSFVVWSSLIGTISAVLGVVVAVWMYSPRQRYRNAGVPTSVPYRGWKRWHTIIGLFFGVVTVTWTFSGLLSMGPFPIMDRLVDLTVPPATAGETDAGAGPQRGRGARGPDVAGALRGGRPPLSAYAARGPAAAVAAAMGWSPDFDVKELEFTSFAGEPVYLATSGHGRTLIVPVQGEPREAFDIEAVMRAVREAAGSTLADVRVMEQYDAYYVDRRRELPLPVIRARLNDAVSTRYYIDPATARVAGTYTARGWANRWLYHGLHSLDFPWLYNHRPLWDIVVITLMLGGTALCITSLVLTWRVLTRKLAAVFRARFTPPNEDLALDA